MLKNVNPGFVSSQSSRNLQAAVFSLLLPSRLSFRPSGCLTTWGGSRATALPWHSSETRCWSSSETTSATTGTTSYPELARCRTSDPCPWCVGLFYLKSLPETCLSRVNHLFFTSFFSPRVSIPFLKMLNQMLANGCFEIFATQEKWVLWWLCLKKDNTVHDACESWSSSLFVFTKSSVLRGAFESLQRVQEDQMYL